MTRRIFLVPISSFEPFLKVKDAGCLKSVRRLLFYKKKLAAVARPALRKSIIRFRLENVPYICGKKLVGSYPGERLPCKWSRLVIERKPRVRRGVP